MGKRLLISGALCVAVLASFAGCKETNKAESSADKFEKVFQQTEHSEVYDISRYNCTQYQWFVMDDAGDVIDCGVSMDVLPEIEENDGTVSVFIQTEDSTGSYREYFPNTGGRSQLYERRQEGDGEFIYFTPSTGEFVFPEILEAYWDAGTGEGVNRDSFVNYEESDMPIEDADSAYERARNEVSASYSYNTVSIDYDKEYEMWAVMFSEKGMLGGCKTVYLDSSGKTWLIIAGE